MPLVRGYQIECGSSCQSCLPRGFARSCGSSSALTTIVIAPPPAADSVGEVDGERRVSSVVLSGDPLVNPDGRTIVHGAEVQDPSLIARQRGTLDLRRYQHRLKEPFFAIPLKGASGANGTRIRRLHSTSSGCAPCPR